MALDNAKVGSLAISKGNLKNVQINLWDKVNPCMGTKCKYAHLCPYDRAEIPPEEHKKDLLCLIESRYLDANLQTFMQLLEKINDSFLMQWVGMHLIPLYYDLCQLKMEKLLIEDIIYEDAKGQKRIHPIFEEIRRVHREIFAIWRITGLKKIAEEAGFFKNGGTIIPNRDPKIHGSGAEYEKVLRGD